jgi:hypothetical protein
MLMMNCQLRYSGDRELWRAKKGNGRPAFDCSTPFQEILFRCLSLI